MGRVFQGTAPLIWIMAFKALLQSRRVPLLESQSGASDSSTITAALVAEPHSGASDGSASAVIVNGWKKTNWRGRGDVWIKWMNGKRISSSRPEMSAAKDEI